MNETLSHLFLWAMACSFTKYFRFPHIISYLPWESRTCFYFVVQKMERKKMNSAVYCIWWQIRYCFAHSSKQSKCCFGEWAVTVPAPRQHHTININKREKKSCPQGEATKVHELKMSPITFGKGEQVCGMSLYSFMHKTDFAFRELKLLNANTCHL